MAGPAAPNAPSSGADASKPIGSITSACCNCDDYSKEINVDPVGRYSRTYNTSGTPYYWPDRTKYQLLVPLKSATPVVVKSRLRVEPLQGVTADDVTAAKSKLESGVKRYWNLALNITIEDPACPKRTLQIAYQPEWVTSDEHRIVRLHVTYTRAMVFRNVMNVGKDSPEKTYAHEYGHVIGMPDEYSYTQYSETVKYYQPDGTLGPAIKTDSEHGHITTPDDSLMANGNRVLIRRGWAVAIETQELLTQKLGRKIRCTITPSMGY